MTIRLSGQPQYAERANHLASWLLPPLGLDPPSDLLGPARAPAVEGGRCATRDASEDAPRVIPQALRKGYVRRQVAGTLAARVHGDNVDHDAAWRSRRAGTYQALRAPHRGQGRRALRTWLAEKLDGKPASVVGGGRHLLVPELQEAGDALRSRARGRHGRPGGR